MLNQENPDILIIVETHFKVRTKTPQKYLFIEKSKTSYKKTARGGVAVYLSKQSPIKIDIISTDFNDLIVFNVRDSDTTVAAVYLPPINSDYFSKDTFDALDLICHTFSSKSKFYIIGDFNARIGTPASRFEYLPNPDSVINSHRRSLMDIINKHDLMIINGCLYDRHTYESAFTFFRSTKKSQIDLAACNDINAVNKLTILQKSPVSDHCPIILSINAAVQPSLSIIRECSRGSFNYDHADINKRLPQKINVKNIDPNKLINELQKLADNITTRDQTDIESLSNHLTQEIYNACKSSVNKKQPLIEPPNTNCNSKNIRAISNAFFHLYNHKINSNASVDEVTIAAQQWWDYNRLAIDMEKKELNTSINKKWAHCRKNDPRKMWKMIDWKGHSQEKPSSDIDPISINRYFTNIFQSDKTSNHLTIADIQADVDSYRPNSQLLDNQMTIEELKTVLNNVGRGTGLDGIPPTICNLFPESLCNVILKLMQSVFYSSTYPDSWSSQLLFSIEKKGHSLSDPKLRGIAISSLFPRIYDTVIDNRFTSWYHPNKAQSGYRTGQGGILQLFYVSLLLELSLHSGSSLYLLLVDYEKAFDYPI